MDETIMLSVAVASSIGTQTDPLEAGAHTQVATHTEAGTQEDAGMQEEGGMQADMCTQTEEAGTGSQPAQADNWLPAPVSAPVVPPAAHPAATQFPTARMPAQGEMKGLLLSVSCYCPFSIGHSSTLISQH